MRNINSMREMQARRMKDRIRRNNIAQGRPEPFLILETPEELAKVFDLAKLQAPWEDIVEIIVSARERKSLATDPAVIAAGKLSPAALVQAAEEARKLGPVCEEDE